MNHDAFFFDWFGIDPVRNYAFRRIPLRGDEKLISALYPGATTKYFSVFETGFSCDLNVFGTKRNVQSLLLRDGPLLLKAFFLKNPTPIPNIKLYITHAFRFKVPKPWQNQISYFELFSTVDFSFTNAGKQGKKLVVFGNTTLLTSQEYASRLRLLKRYLRLGLQVLNCTESPWIRAFNANQEKSLFYNLQFEKLLGIKSKVEFFSLLALTTLEDYIFLDISSNQLLSDSFHWHCVLSKKGTIANLNFHEPDSSLYFLSPFHAFKVFKDEEKL